MKRAAIPLALAVAVAAGAYWYWRRRQAHASSATVGSVVPASVASALDVPVGGSSGPLYSAVDGPASPTPSLDVAPRGLEPTVQNPAPTASTPIIITDPPLDTYTDPTNPAMNPRYAAPVVEPPAFMPPVPVRPIVSVPVKLQPPSSPHHPAPPVSVHVPSGGGGHGNAPSGHGGGGGGIKPPKKGGRK